MWEARYLPLHALTTLLASRYFEWLLEENGDGIILPGACIDDEGSIFLDRDPQLFSQILAFLRSSFDPEHLTVSERANLQKEVEYYQLDGLFDILRPPCRGYDERLLSKKDLEMLEEAQHVLKTLLPGEQTEEADKYLIDLFPEGGPRLTIMHQEKPSSPEATLLFDKHVETARRSLDRDGVPCQ